MVLPDGEVVELGGAVEDVPGYDLRGLVIGGEGTFGIVTAATCAWCAARGARRLLAVFDDVDDATAPCRASSPPASCRRRSR
jgi:glycolate oxidase